jgi:hypothetical protein
MKSDLTFDMSEEIAAEIIKAKLLTELGARKYSKYIHISSVGVNYDRRRRTFTQQIQFEIFNDYKHKESIIRDSLLQFCSIPIREKLSDILEDSEHTLVSYHSRMISIAARQARKAFAVYNEHKKEVLIPILMRVLP